MDIVIKTPGVSNKNKIPAYRGVTNVAKKGSMIIYISTVIYYHVAVFPVFIVSCACIGI
jgi:hypothetical protein